MTNPLQCYVRHQNIIERCVKMLNGLNSKAASGPKNIHARFLNEIACDIAPILTPIFQNSLDYRRSSHEWKSANVTPILKKGDKRHKCIRPLTTARYR